MLSILHPEVMPEIRRLPMGLLPIRIVAAEALVLAIKAPKEMILTARVKQGFKFYVAPLATNLGVTPGLITAFFDDADEPLVIKTPIFDDELTDDLREILNYETLDIYFFDEHCREWMSYRATLRDGGSCLKDGTAMKLFEITEKRFRAVLEGLGHWFGQRSSEDDERAISVTFTEALAPDDVLIGDASVTANDYLGSKGFHHSLLERENPGYYQERDIAVALRRTFSGERIAINPLRADNGKEFADALAVLDKHLLIVQAKDSPNTETSLSRTLARKRHTTAAQLEKGLKQAIGAAKFARGRDSLDLLIDGRPVSLAVERREPFCAVVIKELFDDEGPSYRAAVEAMAAAGVKGVVLDYPSLHAFTHWIREEALLLATLDDLRAAALATSTYPNLHTFLIARLGILAHLSV
jgi:hypothetical protein